LPKQRTRHRPHPPVSRKPAAFERARQTGRAPSGPPPTVSGRWLLKAVAISIAGAAFCCWAALCLLFWQGSWQLLYHPAAAINRTPVSAGIGFDSVAFATTDTGLTRLTGWWIAADPAGPFRRYTVLYLHGKDGNLGDAVGALAALHAAGLNVLAFDYRGYGQSRFARPSEAHWRQDTEWALQYLAGTRHIAPGEIVLDGDGLGANLALEVAAAHPELAGVILRDPLPDATRTIFDDPRAQLVPARLLVRDRYDLDAPALKLLIPSLWFLHSVASGSEPAAYRKVAPRKMLVWLPPGPAGQKAFAEALTRWLADLPDHGR
jgi:uncharacterized protein